MRIGISDLPANGEAENSGESHDGSRWLARLRIRPDDRAQKQNDVGNREDRLRGPHPLTLGSGLEETSQISE